MHKGEHSPKSSTLNPDNINKELHEILINKDVVSKAIIELEKLKRFIIEPLVHSKRIVMSSGPLNITPNFETAIKEFKHMLPREPFSPEIIQALEVIKTNEESVELAKNISNHKFIETVANDPKNLLAVTMELISALKNIELKLQNNA